MKYFKKKCLIIMFLSLTSCIDDKSKKVRPSISQSIEYITQKLNDVEITTSIGVFHNVKFKELDGKVNYSYELISAATNTHYKITQLFYLKDIDYVSSNSFGSHEYLNLNLDKKSCHRFFSPRNEREYNQKKEVWDDIAKINIKSSSEKSIKKAFENIISIQKENRAEKYINE